MVVFINSHDHGTVSRKGSHQDTIERNHVLARKDQKVSSLPSREHPI